MSRPVGISTHSACLRDSLNGVSLPGAALRRYLGTSSTACLNHLRTALPDSLESPTISRRDCFSRKYIRLTLPIMVMVITHSPLL